MKTIFEGIDYDFIEIGTSDFQTLIEEASDEAIGLSVEPISYYLNKLPNPKNVGLGLPNSISKLEEALTDSTLSEEYQTQLADLKVSIEKNVNSLKNHYIQLDQSKKKA